MAHQFDTGETRAQRSLIRAAVVAKLAPLLSSNGLYLRAIKPFAKVFASRSGEELMDDLGFAQEVLQGQAPAILVALGDKSYKAGGTRSPQTSFFAELDIRVYVLSEHNRAREAGRLSDDASSAVANSVDPGIDIMLEHVEQLLIGFTPDVNGAQCLRPTSETEIVTLPGISIWEQAYHCNVERWINPDRAITAMLLSIRNENNLENTAAPNPLAITITGISA